MGKIVLFLVLCMVLSGTEADFVNNDHQRKAQSIAFWAVQTSTMGPNPDDQTIVFDEVLTNHGDDFYVNWGQFVCRTQGTYQFHWTAYRDNPADRYETVLYRNDQPVVASYISPGSQGQAGNSAIINLVPGDEVYVILKAGSSIRNFGPFRMASFNGHILAEGASCFFALRSAPLIASGSEMDVVYDEVLLNSGENYDALSGIYTANTYGLYQFHWAAGTTSPNASTHTALFHNSNPIIGTRDNTSSQSITVENMAILEMSPGDTVQIRLMDGHSIENAGSAFNTSTTAFSGRWLFDLDNSTTPTSAFFAVRESLFSADIIGREIPYDVEIIDTENNYNHETGYFTANISGTYQFFVSAYGVPDFDTQIDFCHDGNEIVVVSLYQGENVQSVFTTSVILDMEAGEFIFQTLTSFQTITSGVGGRQRMVAFSGNLLF